MTTEKADQAMISCRLVCQSLDQAGLSILAPFIAYPEIILSLVAIVLTWAWLRLLWQRKISPSSRTTMILVIMSTMIFFIAIAVPQWENGTTKQLWAYMIET